MASMIDVITELEKLKNEQSRLYLYYFNEKNA